MPSPPLLDRRCAHIAAHQPERVGIPPGNGSVSVLRPCSPPSLCTRACAPPSEPSGMHPSYMNTEGVGMSGRDESMHCAHDYQYRTARHLAQLRSGAPVLAAVFLHTMVCMCVCGVCVVCLVCALNVICVLSVLSVLSVLRVCLGCASCALYVCFSECLVSKKSHVSPIARCFWLSVVVSNIFTH